MDSCTWIILVIEKHLRSDFARDPTPFYLETVIYPLLAAKITTWIILVNVKHMRSNLVAIVKHSRTNALPGRSFCIGQLKAKIDFRSTQSGYLLSKLTYFVGELTFTKHLVWQCNELVMVKHLRSNFARDPTPVDSTGCAGRERSRIGLILSTPPPHFLVSAASNAHAPQNLDKRVYSNK